MQSLIPNMFLNFCHLNSHFLSSLCRIFMDNDFERKIWRLVNKNISGRSLIWAHVCRDWRSLVFKYDLLEEFMERFDEDEDFISDWIFTRYKSQHSTYSGSVFFECISHFSNLFENPKRKTH